MVAHNFRGHLGLVLTSLLLLCYKATFLGFSSCDKTSVQLLTGEAIIDRRVILVSNDHVAFPAATVMLVRQLESGSVSFPL